MHLLSTPHCIVRRTTQSMGSTDRQHQGNRHSGFQHKFSLFADYVLVYLNDPSFSLPNLMNLLLGSGTLAGLKIVVEDPGANL